MIEVSHVSKTYAATRSAPAVQALHDVSLTVDRGQVLGVIGPSGSGKSTLGRCLTLLERPSSGTVRLDDAELTALDGPGLRAARRRLGVVFQHFNLLDSRTAVRNVELPLEIDGVPAPDRRERALAALARVGLADKARSHPAQLSGGQQQRVAIARAVVGNPSVLVCDEATSALDPRSTEQVVQLVRELTQELALTTVLITHEMSVARAACDQLALLEDGRLVRHGALADVLAAVAS